MSDQDWYADERCPKCGGKVRVEFDCPGYPVGAPGATPTVMVCLYGCSNATLFECVGEGCGWWWREPNNRGTRAYRDQGWVEMGPSAPFVTAEKYRG